MNITLSEFVVLAAGILTVINLIDKIFLIKKQIDKPAEERLRSLEAKLIQHDQKFEDHERLLEAHSGYLDADKQKIEVLEKGNRVMSKALLVLINKLNGTVNEERLKEVEEELDKYIFQR